MPDVFAFVSAGSQDDGIVHVLGARSCDKDVTKMFKLTLAISKSAARLKRQTEKALRCSRVERHVH